MSKRPRRNHAPSFKAKVALDALKGDQTLVDLTGLAWHQWVGVGALAAYHLVFVKFFPLNHSAMGRRLL